MTTLTNPKCCTLPGLQPYAWGLPRTLHGAMHSPCSHHTHGPVLTQRMHQRAFYISKNHGQTTSGMKVVRSHRMTWRGRSHASAPGNQPHAHGPMDTAHSTNGFPGHKPSSTSSNSDAEGSSTTQGHSTPSTQHPQPNTPQEGQTSHPTSWQTPSGVYTNLQDYITSQEHEPSQQATLGSNQPKDPSSVSSSSTSATATPGPAWEVVALLPIIAWSMLW